MQRNQPLGSRAFSRQEGGEGKITEWGGWWVFGSMKMRLIQVVIGFMDTGFSHSRKVYAPRSVQPITK
jgi:hypothetical protein